MLWKLLPMRLEASPGTEGQGAAFRPKIWDVGQARAGRLARQREMHRPGERRGAVQSSRTQSRAGPAQGHGQVGVGGTLPALPSAGGTLLRPQVCRGAGGLEGFCVGLSFLLSLKVIPFSYKMCGLKIFSDQLPPP